MDPRTPLDIVWNLTLLCPWDCGICCVDAAHVRRRGSVVTIADQALGRRVTLPAREGFSPFQLALEHRQGLGLELRYDEKLRVLDHLSGHEVHLDISGGDPLLLSENLRLLAEASRRFGRENITLTATGAGLARHPVDDVARFIGELNFTYDGVRSPAGGHRPSGYAESNLRHAGAFARRGIAARAECPLTSRNSSPGHLRGLYADLHAAGVQTLLVMRLFPVGRGGGQGALIPSPAQYRAAIEVLREMERTHGSPVVEIQCALKFFDDPGMVADNPCDALRSSFGLMADGTLLISPWAIGPEGRPLSGAWVLGNLASTSLSEILAQPRSCAWTGRLDENFGHCKILAYLNSDEEDPLERLLDTTDPLIGSGVPSMRRRPRPSPG